MATIPPATDDDDAANRGRSAEEPAEGGDDAAPREPGSPEG